MTIALPIGYLTILQAADVLLPVMYGGVADYPTVSQLRQQGEERSGWAGNIQSYC
jgi:hypothetical protein